jgi:putative hydrolase of the HAD superfamily
MHYMPLRGVLFDMDDTLFDHTYSTDQALAALRVEESTFAAWPPHELRERHSAVLETLHAEVLSFRLSIPEAREERFRRLFTDAAAAPPPPGRAMQLADVYRLSYRASWRPVAGAMDLLTSLRADNLIIAIVTNNLVAEQTEKLRACKMDPLIDALITSEEIGVQKPDPHIFRETLTRLGLQPDEAVMVGDAWRADVVGAIAADIRPVWFNWRGMATPDPNVEEIASLEPLAQAAAVIRGRKL